MTSGIRVKNVVDNIVFLIILAISFLCLRKHLV